MTNINKNWRCIMEVLAVCYFRIKRGFLHLVDLFIPMQGDEKEPGVMGYFPKI